MPLYIIDIKRTTLTTNILIQQIVKDNGGWYYGKYGYSVEKIL